MQTSDSITATFTWVCACGTKVTGSTEESVVAAQGIHRRKHILQVRAIISGDTKLAARIMRPEPAEGWVPGYNC